MQKLPLTDYRILITRGKKQAIGLSRAVEQYGGTPIVIPLLDFQAPQEKLPIYEHLHRLRDYDWVILTSQNGVRSFFKHLEEASIPITTIPKIAVIGQKTEETLRKFGFQAGFIPSNFVAESFVEEFIPKLSSGARVLVAKGNLSRNLIAEAIRQAKGICDEIIVYETVLPEESIAKLVAGLKAKQIDVVTFTSGSTVQHFWQIVQKYQLSRYIDKLIIACIGPIAKEAAVGLGLKVDVCPNVYTAEAMLHSLCEYIALEGGRKNEL